MDTMRAVNNRKSFSALMLVQLVTKKKKKKTDRVWYVWSHLQFRKAVFFRKKTDLMGGEEIYLISIPSKSVMLIAKERVKSLFGFNQQAVTL